MKMPIEEGRLETVGFEDKFVDFCSCSQTVNGVTITGMAVTYETFYFAITLAR